MQVTGQKLEQLLLIWKQDHLTKRVEDTKNNSEVGESSQWNICKFAAVMLMLIDLVKQEQN